ncbi:MAG: SLC13 family permease, partial [Phycisphaeraceae bacterium]|nr:SLC13 family permease [Phycisphaeraceae bacterium]
MISVTALAAVAVWWGLPSSVDEGTRRLLAIFLVAAVFWATEVLALFATSLLTIGFLVLFLADPGGLAHWLPTRSSWNQGPLAYTEFLVGFGSPVIILFMGGFLLSAAMERHGVARMLARRLLVPASVGPRRLVLAVLALAAGLSMWMSNTAAAALMTALLAPLLTGLDRESRLAPALVLAVAFGANIGGMATPIGTPPNAVAYGLLAASPTPVSFLTWVGVGLPITVIMLLVAWGVLGRGLKGESVPGEVATGPPLSGRGRATL